MPTIGNPTRITENQPFAAGSSSLDPLYRLKAGLPVYQTNAGLATQPATAQYTSLPYYLTGGSGGGGGGLTYEQALNLKASQGAGVSQTDWESATGKSFGSGAPKGIVGFGVASAAGGGGGGGGAAKSLEAFPGYNAIMQDISGVISPDVKAQLEQTAAERGISMGTPGAPVNDASLMKAIGLTSDQLRARGIAELSPLYEQQVSEAGQTSRLGMSLASQMEQLQYSTNAQMQMQGAQIAAQNALAQMQEAGLDYRQAQSLAAQLQQLAMSESGQDRRQAADLAAAMDRLKVGAANQRDLQLLSQQAQLGLAQLQAQTQLTTAGMSEQGALQRALLSSATQYGITGMTQTGEAQRQAAQIAAQQQEAAAQRSLQKYIADEQAKLGYFSSLNRGYYGYGGGGYGGAARQTSTAQPATVPTTSFWNAPFDYSGGLSGSLPVSTGSYSGGSTGSAYEDMGGGWAYNPTTGEILDSFQGQVPTSGGYMYSGQNPYPNTTPYDPTLDAWLQELYGLGYGQDNSEGGE